MEAKINIAEILRINIKKLLNGSILTIYFKRKEANND